MTTRLSQRKVKGGDPSFQNLQEELQARTLGTGTGTGGYTPPATGIPKSDLSQHLKDLLSAIEAAKLIGAAGVSQLDLDPALLDAYEKAMSAYQKPTTGIPLIDLDETIQSRLTDFASYYVYPTGGIPKVDLDSHVTASLALADTAYQLPEGGITSFDLSETLLGMIGEGLTRYAKPETGIPASDLEEEYLLSSAIDPINEHINDATLHIRNHDDLLNVGEYSHRQIDETLKEQMEQLNIIWRELFEARDEFSTIGNRISSLLGLNSFYSVQENSEWLKGTLHNLSVNDEGFVGLTYESETPIMSLHDVSVNGQMTDDNDIGRLRFETDSRIFLGTNPWQHTIKKMNDVGVRLKTNIYIDKTGTYEFATQFSGRVRLQVGSKLLYDTQGLYGQVDAYTRTNSVELEAGRLYTLLLEGWYGSEGDRVVGLSWKRPGANSFQEINPKYFNNSGYLVTQGMYESEIIDMKDNNISKWIFELDASENRAKDDIVIQLRTSEDGQDWQDWLEIEDSGEIMRTPHRYAQVRIRLYQHHPFYSPVLRGYRIRYISSTNNEIMNELAAARSGFSTIESRFLNIESMMQDLARFIELQNKELFHPEFFASVRLASQELNMIQLMLIEATRKLDYILLDQGVVDPLKTLNFIDATKSDPHELIASGIRTLRSTKRLEGNAEWAQWELDGLDYGSGSLRLDYSTNAAISNTTGFGNWYLWSTRDTARLAGNYQSYIAQPFYTGDLTNLLTRLQLQSYDASWHPQTTFMICDTIAGTNEPNVANPIWAVTSWSYGVVNFTNLRIPVNPKTKYWIVLKREALQNQTGYSRWYLSYNNTSTNARLRGTNPEGAYLYVRYTSGTGDTKPWLTDSGYFLSFHIDEAQAYVSEGRGHRIIDYGESTNFVSSEVTRTLPTEPILDIVYQGSNDASIWSAPETNIDLLPPSRFVKISVHFKKATASAGTTALSRIDLHSVLEYSDVVTHAIDAIAVPTHAIYQASHDEGIEFFISRDDGVTWQLLEPRTFTQLDSIMPGMSVRLKMRFDGNYPTSTVRDYGFIFTSYRDITQQNVTALYEEYIAEEEQSVFRLRDKYVMGNHSLQVYLNGIRQSVFKDYDEVDRNTIMFKEPLIGGLDADRVTFIVSTGAYDQHDATMHQKIEEAQERSQQLNTSHSKRHVYNGSGQLESTIFNPQYYIQRYDYEYNEAGRKIKETKTTKTYIEVIEYNYNDEGFLTEETITISEVTI